MAARRRRRAPNDGGSIDQLPSGRWRLRVRQEAGQRTYGVFESEEAAFRAQARWRLTHLLPDDDPNLSEPVSPNVVVGGVRCDEWFGRWQDAKRERRSVVRLDRGRGGAESTAARDRAQWSGWWKGRIGDRLPQTVSKDDVAEVLRDMETAGRAPNTIRTHWVMVRAFFNWLVSTGVLDSSPVDGVTITVDPAGDRVRDIVVPDFQFLDLLAQQLREPEDRLIFELLLGTGGRRSEVAGIRIRDVDLGAHRVWIREPVVEVGGHQVRNRRPKGGRDRSVIVGPNLAGLLRTHLAGLVDCPPDTPLFAGHRGGGLRWGNYFPRRLRPAIEAAATRWAAWSVVSSIEARPGSAAKGSGGLASALLGAGTTIVLTDGQLLTSRAVRALPAVPLGP